MLTCPSPPVSLLSIGSPLAAGRVQATSYCVGLILKRGGQFPAPGKAASRSLNERRPWNESGPERERPRLGSASSGGRHGRCGMLSQVVERAPLTTLLAWAWVAFTIEIDNAVEATGSEHVGRLFRISLFGHAGQRAAAYR